MQIPPLVRAIGVAVSLCVASCGGGEAAVVPAAPSAQPVPPPSATADNTAPVPTATAPAPTATAPSPTPTATTPVAATPCTGPSPGPGYVCMQDCGPPVVVSTMPPPGWSWLSAADAKNRKAYGCPICLPPEARVATPTGDRPVSELAVGDALWTLDAAGKRAPARVVYVGSTPIGGRHSLVRVTLADGRVVSGSAGHPTGTGETLGSLRVGQSLGGAAITSVEVVAFGGERTWDVLPSGPTGLYVVDGVPLQSSFVQHVAR